MPSQHRYGVAVSPSHAQLRISSALLVRRTEIQSRRGWAIWLLWACLVDLVTTGPEAGGVANRSTAVVVSDLFRNAQRSVLIAGYAIYQGQKVFQSLAERMGQHSDLQVRMFLDVPRVHGDTSSISTQIARFVRTFKTSQWPKGAPLPCVYCCEQIMETQTGKPRIPARKVHCCRQRKRLRVFGKFYASSPEQEH